MTDRPSAWRSTGLHWESAVPTFTAAALDTSGRAGAEHRRPVVIGQWIAWALTGPRRCIGLWSGAQRLPCPTADTVPGNGTDAQCGACASGERGRAVARDAALGDDDRTYALYLAWFGPGLFKVGLTAADRGRDRLLEQGAITATLLATGPYTTIRRAERAIATAGLASERIGARTKADVWWKLPVPADRARQLIDARDAILTKTPLPPGASPASGEIIDQAADFGLIRPVPAAYAEVRTLTEDAVLAGAVSAIIGRQVLLTSPSGPILTDMRRLAGWCLTPTDQSAPANLETAQRTRLRDDHADQPSLF